MCDCEPAGLRPVQLYVDEVNVRAWPGGAGDNKIGANYAPTIAPQAAASRQHGTAQARSQLPRRCSSAHA